MAEMQFSPDDPEYLAMMRAQQTHAPTEGAGAVMPPAGPAPAPAAMTSDLPRVPVAAPAAPPAPANDNAPPPPPPAMPVVGPTVTKTGTWQSGESYVKPTAEYNAAKGEMAGAGKANVAAAVEAKAAKTDFAKAQAEEAQFAADARAAAETHAQEQEHAARQNYEQGSAFLASERERITKENTTDYWHDKSTASHVLSALMVGIGEVGAKLTGGTNAALNILDTAVARDAQLKEHRLRAEMDKLGVKGAEARERFEYARTEILNAKAAAWQKIEADRTARLLKAGVPLAEVEGDAIVAAAKTNAAANQMAAERDLLHHVNKASGGSQTTSNEEQNKAAMAAAGLGAGAGRAAGKQMEQAMLATQAKDDLKIIDNGPRLSTADLARVQDNSQSLKGVEHAQGVTGVMGTKIGRKLGIVPRSPYEGLSPEKQKVANAIDLLAQKSASLVSTSSAKDEIEAVKAKFMPTATDSPAAVKQKIDLMRTIVATAESNAGAYGTRAEAAAGRAQAAADARTGGGAAPLPALSMQDMQTLRDEVRAGGPNAAAAARTLAAYANRGR